MSSQRVGPILRRFWSSRAFDKSYALKITLPALCRVPGGERKIELRKGAVKVLVTQSCPTLCKPMDCSPTGSSVQEILQARNTGVSSNSLLQGIFPTQGLNPGLPHCRQILYGLSHQGSPYEGSCRQTKAPEWVRVDSAADGRNRMRARHQGLSIVGRQTALSGGHL